MLGIKEKEARETEFEVVRGEDGLVIGIKEKEDVREPNLTENGS